MGAVRLDSIQHSTSEIMLSVVAVTLLAALANASPQFYGQYGYQFGTPAIMAMVENSIAQTAHIPGAANTQPTSDAEFAAYREKQNKIFDSSKDLVAQLSDLKFY